MIKFLQTPSQLKKIVLGGLLLLICAAMVITLIPGGIMGNSFGFGASPGVLARVGDQEITMTDAQRMAQNLVRQRFGKQTIPPQFMGIFVQQAMDQLIAQKVMLSEAERMGLRVSDEELRYDLEHGQLGSVFFPNGNFIGQDQYQNLLTQNGYSVTQFESELKSDILVRKLYDIIAGAAAVSEADVKQEFLRRNTKVKFEYAVLTMDDVTKQIHPADAELKAFYEKNKKNYENTVPEKRKAQYILIDTAKLKESAKVSADDLRRYYQQHQEEYRVPEQVKVRHILIKAPPAGADGKPDPK